MRKHFQKLLLGILILCLASCGKTYELPDSMKGYLYELPATKNIGGDWGPVWEYNPPTIDEENGYLFTESDDGDEITIKLFPEEVVGVIIDYNSDNICETGQYQVFYQFDKRKGWQELDNILTEYPAYDFWEGHVPDVISQYSAYLNNSYQFIPDEDAIFVDLVSIPAECYNLDEEEATFISDGYIISTALTVIQQMFTRTTGSFKLIWDTERRQFTLAEKLPNEPVQGFNNRIGKVCDTGEEIISLFDSLDLAVYGPLNEHPEYHLSKIKMEDTDYKRDPCDDYSLHYISLGQPGEPMYNSWQGLKDSDFPIFIYSDPFEGYAYSIKKATFIFVDDFTNSGRIIVDIEPIEGSEGGMEDFEISYYYPGVRGWVYTFSEENIRTLAKNAENLEVISDPCFGELEEGGTGRYFEAVDVPFLNWVLEFQWVEVDPDNFDIAITGTETGLVEKDDFGYYFYQGDVICDIDAGDPEGSLFTTECEGKGTEDEVVPNFCVGIRKVNEKVVSVAYYEQCARAEGDPAYYKLVE